MIRHVGMIAMLACLQSSHANTAIYQQPDEFLRRVFGATLPDKNVVWLTPDIAPTVSRIMDHPYPRRRISYWEEGDRSAWILEEIGKEQPITVGLVVKAGQLEIVRVLTYRESRGGEVRHAFFTDQFQGARLTAQEEISKPIDGISGATLSVRALTKLARLALFLHSNTRIP